ncbi:MAG: helveticin J family class III bacteriocin [Anaerostipes sp.]|nr:helveticin J family class III bacteriocin [Anaerostipes sp.]
MRLKNGIKWITCVAMSIVLLEGITTTSYAAVDGAAPPIEGDVNDAGEGNGVTGVFEKDDFDTPEEYAKYLEEHPEEQIQTYAATANKNVNASAKLHYKINMQNFSVKTAIQRAYIGSTYVYITQRKNEDTYITRCTINGNELKKKDGMHLTNFAHSQTLEWFEHNGKDYFWVGCKPNVNWPDIDWATQVGRIQYTAGTTISNYTKICRLSHLSYANKAGSSFGAIKRSDSALSSDRAKMLLWVEDNTGEVQYSYYNMSKINAALDKVESASSKSVEMDSSAIKSACYGSFRQSKSNKVAPNGSNQGVEFTDADSVYIIGGKSDDKPIISKLTGSGSSYKYSTQCTVTNTALIKDAEPEGIQLKGDYIYFGISKPSCKATEQYIYRIPKSAF